jgi:hypothetical protein
MKKMKAKLKEMNLRRKASKKFLKGFRRAAQHLEETGLTREAALIKAGGIYDIHLAPTDLKVVSLAGKKKAA